MLIGRTITAIRVATQEELDDLDFYGRVEILVLNDGTEIWPIKDAEGNGAGVHWIKQGDDFYSAY